MSSNVVLPLENPLNVLSVISLQIQCHCIVIFSFLALNYTAVAMSGKVGPLNLVNHTSWVAVVTPTDRPKSVRKSCVIELVVALFVLSFCPFDNSAGVGAFVIGLSQISSFFSWYSISLGRFTFRFRSID